MRPHPMERSEERSGQPVGFHLEDRELAQYARGSLPAEATARVERHLVSCRACAEVLTHLKADAEAAQTSKELAIASDLEAFRALRAKAPEEDSHRVSVDKTSENATQHGVSQDRAHLIQSLARQAMLELYQRRFEVWSKPPVSPFDMIDPSAVAKLWGIRTEEREDIGGSGGYHFAGLIDVRTKVIVISSAFRLEVRRFTMAHEIGHLMLHADQRVLFRDSPVSGAERLNRNRPPIEREADLFAAELLMPPKLLRKTFRAYFGSDRICHKEVDEGIAAALSYHTGRSIKLGDLKAHGSRTLALHLARSRPWSGRDGPPPIPLCDRFRVSKTAMAIQLESLGLVA